jgi:hypothetical protein
VPQKAAWQQHSSIMVLGQDADNEEITVEAIDDDSTWLGQIAKQLAMNKTVVIEQPSFSGCK